MTKAELISMVAGKTGLTQKDSGGVLDAIIETVTGALKQGEKVALSGFGTFEVRTRAERLGVNPRTKEPMVIDAGKLPAFKAGAALKQAVSISK